jgi:hypothetical protein
MRVIVEKLVEWKLAGETEVLGEYPNHCHFITKNPTWTEPVSNPCHRCEKPATNRLHYGAANIFTYSY